MSLPSSTCITDCSEDRHHHVRSPGILWERCKNAPYFVARSGDRDDEQRRQADPRVEHFFEFDSFFVALDQLLEPQMLPNRILRSLSFRRELRNLGGGWRISRRNLGSTFPRPDLFYERQSQEVNFPLGDEVLDLRPPLVVLLRSGLGWGVRLDQNRSCRVRALRC